MLGELIATDPDPAGAPREYSRGVALMHPKVRPGTDAEQLEKAPRARLRARRRIDHFRMIEISRHLIADARGGDRHLVHVGLLGKTALIGIGTGIDTLTIFDVGGAVLGSVSGDETVFLSSATPIDRFELTGEPFTTPVLDNLIFVVIPEPGTAGLVALDLFAMARAPSRRARPGRAASP